MRPDCAPVTSAQLHAVLRSRLIPGKAASRPRLSDALLARIRLVLTCAQPTDVSKQGEGLVDRTLAPLRLAGLVDRTLDHSGSGRRTPRGPRGVSDVDGAAVCVLLCCRAPVGAQRDLFHHERLFQPLRLRRDRLRPRPHAVSVPPEGDVQGESWASTPSPSESLCNDTHKARWDSVDQMYGVVWRDRRL